VSSQETVRRRVDILTLRYLLANNLIDELQRRMAGYQAALEADITKESDFEQALNTFSIFDPQMEMQLNAWINRYPSSAVAYAARSEYRLASARRARGFGTADALSEAQIRSMVSYIELTAADCNRALKMNPVVTACFVHLITTTTMLSQWDDANETANVGVSYAPASLLIRKRFMWALLPQWGGDYNRMALAAEASQKFVSVNPALRTLKGYVAIDQARQLSREGRFARALDMCNVAETFGGRPEVYRVRASVYYDMGELRSALADCEKGLAYEWQNDDLLELKANILRDMGNQSAAESVTNMVKQLRCLQVMVY